ncbi:MAG: hypothetical protein F6K42_12920 [Leptolyngbya sp. SIO1D8]|nr:hypothetical protein [Leptolyngbya sp. SIO1D8]
MFQGWPTDFTTTIGKNSGIFRSSDNFSVFTQSDYRSSVMSAIAIPTMTFRLLNIFEQHITPDAQGTGGCLV